MHINLRYAAVVLFVVADILITTVSTENEKGSKPASSTSNKLNITQKFLSSNFGRKFTKVVGFAPNSKEDNVEKLVDIVLNDNDLMKMAAYNKLFFLYNQAKTNEARTPIMYGIVQSASELVHFYWASNNSPKAGFTYTQGLRFADNCFIITKNEGECSKLKTVLISKVFFQPNPDKQSNSYMKDFFEKLVKSYTNAIKLQPESTILSFMAKRLRCEMELMGEKRKSFTQQVKSVYTGLLFGGPQFDCVDTLLQLKNKNYNLELGISPGEYYYLLARAYEKQNEINKAMECLTEGLRNGPMTDEKARFYNKQMQDLYEKLSIRINM